MIRERPWIATSKSNRTVTKRKLFTYRMVRHMWHTGYQIQCIVYKGRPNKQVNAVNPATPATFGTHGENENASGCKMVLHGETWSTKQTKKGIFTNHAEQLVSFWNINYRKQRKTCLEPATAPWKEFQLGFTGILTSQGGKGILLSVHGISIWPLVTISDNLWMENICLLYFYKCYERGTENYLDL